MSESSSIILTGEILPEREINEVVCLLARVLRTTEEKTRPLLAGRETVIKRNVPEAEVERYIHVINRAGAGVRSERNAAFPALMTLPELGGQEATQATAPPVRAPAPQTRPLELVAEPAAPSPPGGQVPEAVAVASATMQTAAAGETLTCPECGHLQPRRTLCRQCGCDMPRVRAAREQAAREAQEARNVFSAPDAHVEDAGILEEETFTPGMFGVFPKGRIGRLRYLAYSWATMIVPILMAVILPMVAGKGKSDNTAMLVGMIGAVVVFMLLTVRILVLRMHDINLSGKWLLLLLLLSFIAGMLNMPGLIMFASVVFWLGSLVLVFYPGDGDSNRFGSPCGPNTLIIKIGAFFIVGLGVLGVIGSSLGTRSYQDYLARSKSGSAPAGVAKSSSDPVFAEIHIQQNLAGRDVELVYYGKMMDDKDCEQHSDILIRGFVGKCKTCEVKARSCKSRLTPRDAKLFDNEPIHTTYLSMGSGAADEREGRMLFWGLSADESRTVCEAMRNNVQKSIKGVVQCI